ncbi:hypothetical protein QOT17_005877 [Balamuthia mandrillaris]
MVYVDKRAADLPLPIELQAVVSNILAENDKNRHQLQFTPVLSQIRKMQDFQDYKLQMNNGSICLISPPNIAGRRSCFTLSQHYLNFTKIQAFIISRAKKTMLDLHDEHRRKFTPALNEIKDYLLYSWYMNKRARFPVKGISNVHHAA